MKQKKLKTGEGTQADFTQFVMLGQQQEVTGFRQESVDSGCTATAQRLQAHQQSSETGCNPMAPLVHQGNGAGSGGKKVSPLKPQRSQPESRLLSVKETSALLGISGQAIRDNAADGKYSGAYKTRGNGGEGWVIPLSSLPPNAQALYWHQQFTATALNQGPALAPDEQDTLWKRYEKATYRCQARARHALAALLRFDQLRQQGTGKMQAYQIIQEEYSTTRSTLNLWQSAVDGLPPCHWLPALVPNLSGRTNAQRREWPGKAWMFFLKHATTSGRPLSIAYHSTVREAQAQGWGELPSLRTTRRDWQKLDAAVKTYLREGETALKRLSPTGARDYSCYALHEQWSMDGRRIDLMVRDTHGEFGPRGRVFRLWIYGVMEMRSRYFVGYSLGAELNADAVRDALVDAFTRTGKIIPRIVQVDNGMEAAAKEITGGAPWRRRGKVKEDEIIGLLPMLGIAVSWATPAHGQTKPIERLFGTLSHGETHPDFRQAYCGRSPETRPEEWDPGKAIPIESVRKRLREEIGIYHRTPHTGDSMGKKSPLQVYGELMQAPGFTPRKLSDRQLRACVLSAIPITIQKNGCFIIHGARYYSEQTASLPKGRGYYARYNRHDLSVPVFVYQGSKLVAEEVRQVERIPGNSKAHAQKIMKARRDFMRSKKAAAQALLDLQVQETPQDIARTVAQKHPELVDTETGEILPVAQVTALTHTSAEIPREFTAVEVQENSRIKAMVDEMAALMANPILQHTEHS